MSKSLFGFPVPCDCGKHPERESVPRGMTHSKTARCPHVAEDWQWEVNGGTCCTTDIGDVIEVLGRFGEATLAAKLSKVVTAEQAIKLGEKLESLGEELLCTCEGDPQTDKERKRLADCDTVLAAGDWYRKLGEHGFGVSFVRVTSLTDVPPLQAA